MIIGGLMVAGAVGACCRYLVDRSVEARTRGVFPWGVLVINVSGSLVLGFLTGLALYHGLTTTPRVLLGTGFCGAYTTFSTFTFDTVHLLEEGAPTSALLNTLASLAATTLAAALGLGLAAAL
jgi:CrcB protein